MRNCAQVSFTHKCMRCNYQWNPRTSNPKVCPKCKSIKWHTEKPSRAARLTRPLAMQIDHSTLNLAEASGLLGITPATLKSWVKTGRVKEHPTPSGYPTYKKDEILAVKETFMVCKCPVCLHTWIKKSLGAPKYCLLCKVKIG